MSVPDTLLYSSEHEWVSVEWSAGGDVIAIIGITDYAQDMLGDIVFVRLPVSGASAVSKSIFSEVESTKSVSDIYAPLSGVVVEVNEALVSAPETINTDPYGAGWICKIAVSDPLEIHGLMIPDEYRKFIGH